MKVLTSLTLILLFFLSCADEKNKPAPPVQQATESHTENFDTFFEKFSSDSVFQRSRIKFPLTTETYDIDAEKMVMATIPAREWEFFNIREITRNKKHIYNTRKEKDKYILNATVEDTGIFVDYIFEQRDGKWVMVKIVDQST